MIRRLIILLLIVGCGTEPEDACGVAGGDGTTCADCAGVSNGDAVEDMCSICDSDATNDCVQDCAGVWDGNSYLDECGGCDANVNNDCTQDECGNWGGDGVDADSDSICDDVDDCIVQNGVSQECGCNTGIASGKCDCLGNVDLGCGCGVGCYVGEYDLTKVIFSCGDGTGLDGTNITEGELTCTSTQFLFSMNMTDYECALSNCFVNTNNQGIFGTTCSDIITDSTIVITDTTIVSEPDTYPTLSKTLDGIIVQIGSDTLQITYEGNSQKVYWSKIASNLIIKEPDGWEYYFEEKEE